MKCAHGSVEEDALSPARITGIKGAKEMGHADRIAAALILAASATAAPQHADDPLTRPIVTDRTAEWLALRPPVRVFGNSYLVGLAA
jgi:hypothetical protein